MKAIILAAGYGNRMRPFTDKTHKTLLKIGDQTIIERIINSLLNNDIKNIVVVTGYRDEELKNFLTKRYTQAEINIQYVHNAKYKETNNIYSLSLALNHTAIDDDIILIESDLIFDSTIIKQLILSPYANVALLDKFRSGMDGTVVTVADQTITSIIPPHLQGSDFNFADKYKTLNIYKFSKEFCNTSFKKLLSYYAEIFDANSYYELILGILIYVQKETIYAEIVPPKSWTEVDDPNDLSLAEFTFHPDNRLETVESALGGLWHYDLLDFCYIRNMYFPNHSILAEMKNNLPRLIHNYGSKQSLLDQKLSYFLLCKKENLTVLNGASQIYPILKNYFKGKMALIPKPTFGEYPRIFGNDHFYSDQIGINRSEIEAKAKQHDIIVFVNPNNPTGSIVPTAKIYEFAGNHPQKTIIVDESFIDFSDESSIIDLLEKNPLDNVIVIKSLSKNLGIPGLRIGFVYSTNQSLNEHIKESVPIWNMSSLSEFFLEVILKHKGSLTSSYVKTKQDREAFYQALKKLNFVDQVYPSAGNFILVSLKHFKKENGAKLVNELLCKYNIYIKDVSPKFSDGKMYLRLAVRLKHENVHLIKCLSDVVINLT